MPKEPWHQPTKARSCNKWLQLIKQSAPLDKRRRFQCDTHLRCVTHCVRELLLLEKGPCVGLLRWCVELAVHVDSMTFLKGCWCKPTRWWRTGCQTGPTVSVVLFTHKESCAQNVFVRGTLVTFLAEAKSKEISVSMKGEATMVVGGRPQKDVKTTAKH